MLPVISSELLNNQELYTRIQDSHFSLRLQEALDWGLKIKFVGELLFYKEADLLELRRFGKVSLFEAKRHLGEHNLSLGTLDREAFPDKFAQLHAMRDEAERLKLFAALLQCYAPNNNTPDITSSIEDSFLDGCLPKDFRSSVTDEFMARLKKDPRVIELFNNASGQMREIIKAELNLDGPR